MSNEHSMDDRRVTLSAAYLGEKVSLYLAPGRIAALKQKGLDHLFEPDLTHGAMIRCDWNGDLNEFGTFEVKGIDGHWEPIGKLGPNDANLQLVSKYHKVTQVHVQRGPTYPGIKFAVKLLPIVWLVELVMPDEHWREVTRGVHYTYKAGYTFDDVAWKESAAVQGAHQLVWENLDKDQDYEIWVKLWGPNASDPPQVQDPVIRTGGHIPSKESDHSGRQEGVHGARGATSA